MYCFRKTLFFLLKLLYALLLVVLMAVVATSISVIYDFSALQAILGARG
jgi:hypothetical protein